MVKVSVIPWFIVIIVAAAIVCTAAATTELEWNHSMYLSSVVMITYPDWVISYLQAYPRVIIAELAISFLYQR